MERYTVEERAKFVELYYKHSSSMSVTMRKIRAIFPRNHVPSKTCVRNIIKKFEKTGSVQDVKPSIRFRSRRSTENINAVKESVENNPNTSIRQRAQELDLSTTTLRRILTQDLALHVSNKLKNKEAESSSDINSGPEDKNPPAKKSKANDETKSSGTSEAGTGEEDVSWKKRESSESRNSVPSKGLIYVRITKRMGKFRWTAKE